MESEKEKTPSNINSAGKQEEKIDSGTSARSSVGHEDSQQASEQTSSATSASSCKAKSAEKPAKNKKPLDGNNGMQLCLGCNTELDLTYKFCYECGKPVQEIVSSVLRKQDTNHSHAQVGDSGRSTQTSNRVTDVPSNLTGAREHILGETQGTFEDTVGQVSQQPITVSEEPSANENGNVKEALQEEDRNESNESDAEHTVSGTAEVISNNVTVAKKIEEITHVVTQQTGTTKRSAGMEKNLSTSQEKTVIVYDQRNKTECGGTDSTVVDIIVQTPNEDLMSRADSNLDTTRKTSINSKNKPVESDVTRSVTAESKPNDKEKNYSVSRKLDEKFGDHENKQTARTENISLEQRMQPPLQKSEEENTNKNSDISHTGDEESDVDKNVREELDAKISPSKQQTATENSEGGLNTKSNVQKNLDSDKETVVEKGDEKIKNDESAARRTTRSTMAKSQSNDTTEVSDKKEETLSSKSRETRSHPLSEDNPSVGSEVENEASDTKKETILSKSKETLTHPLSEDKSSAGSEVEKNELEEDTKKSKKKGKGKTDDKTSTNREGTKTLTVVFHAILSDKFDFNDKSRIVIRGQEPVFSGWSKDGVVMKTEKYLPKQFLVHGEFSVPLHIVSGRCGYKYVLLNEKDKPTYEQIVEYQSAFGAPVNRCLDIQEIYILQNKTFHKYDGFIYPKPGKVSWARFFHFGSAMNDRQTFFRNFFPKWSGFSAEPIDETHLVEALQNLQYLVEGVTCFCTSVSGEPYRRSVDKDKLKLSQLFEEILMPKLQENLKALDDQTSDVKAKVHAVVSSVVIAYVFTKYHVNLNSASEQILWKCLKLPSNKEVCSEFVKIVDEFDDNLLSSLKQIILKFYQQEKRKWNKSFVVSWLPALPVLHFLRRESKPFEDVICEKPVDVANWKWWGLDGFPYRDIREHINESEAFEMLPDLNDEVFDMDPLLKRTFLLLCPVEMYGDLLKNERFSCLDRPAVNIN